MFNAIKEGNTIGVIAPAWIALPERLQNGISYLEDRGFKIKRGRHLESSYGYFAGNDRQRSEDIQQMFEDPEIAMILCTRGGWGGLRLLDFLDYDAIANNPKPLIGYSDVTTLQLALWKKCGLPSFSGPMLAVEMAKGMVGFTEEHFWGLIQNRRPEYIFPFLNTAVEISRAGNAGGTLLGGCLSLVCHLLGTPYAPDYEGAVLFLEDVGEKPYKIDRYLAHLKQAGIFDQINALILGDFIDCEAEENERSLTIREIFDDYFANASYPVVRNFPYGHGEIKLTMPVGAAAQIDTTRMQIKFSNPFLP